MKKVLQKILFVLVVILFLISGCATTNNILTSTDPLSPEVIVSSYSKDLTQGDIEIIKKETLKAVNDICPM